MLRWALAALLLGAQDADLDKLDLRVKPLSPREELLSFRLEPGYRIELVAAEPEVNDPVAAAFDEKGRLYVCAMGDYPYGPKPGEPPRGRVLLLEDRDGDGRYETSRVFVDRLPWPSGIACWKGGVYVISSPDLWYFKDADGDGKADVRRRVCTGFQVGAAEECPNTLAWGVDNRIYGSSSGSGGRLVPDGAPDVNVRGRDFRFDPRTNLFEAVSGNSRFGTTFDDAGNRFCGNANSLGYHPVIPDEALARNPYLAVSGVTDAVARETRVTAISEPEPWKVARQKFWAKFVDTAPEMRAGRFPAQELAPQGFVTGAAGVCVYRGTACPKLRGDLFSGEPPNNVLVRHVLRPEGASFRGEHVAAGKREFLSSTDTWFRPVMCLNGPDGALYVLDMYREIIEFFDAIPEGIRKRTDVTSGWDRGRIWRIVPADWAPPARKDLSTGEAFRSIGSEDAWERETAQRLIYERQDENLGALDLAAKYYKPAGKITALWSLEGLGGLTEEILIRALGDASPLVREHAVRLAEPRLKASAALRNHVIARTGDAELRVRFRAALALALAPDAQALVELARRDAADPWMRKALLIACAEAAPAVLRALGPEASELRAGLLQIVAARGKPEELREALAGALADRTLLAETLARGGAALVDAARGDAALEKGLAEAFERARAESSDAAKPAAVRAEAVRLLAHAPFSPALADLLAPAQPPEVQRAAVQSLALQRDALVPGLLLGRWRTLGPALRSEVLESLFRRPERLPALLDAIEQGGVAAGDLAAERRQALLRHRDQAVAERAARLLGTPSSSRQDVVEKYRKALEGLKGDSIRGAEIFKKTCSACHVLGGEGTAVGPALAGAALGTDALLVALFDPNREVQGPFVNYLVQTKDGATYAGILAEETATSLTLRRAQGEQDVILRVNVKELVSSRLSLMPENLEAGLDPQGLADLLRYVQAPR